MSLKTKQNTFFQLVQRITNILELLLTNNLQRHDSHHLNLHDAVFPLFFLHFCLRNQAMQLATNDVKRSHLLGVFFLDVFFPRATTLI